MLACCSWAVGPSERAEEYLHTKQAEPVSKKVDVCRLTHLAVMVMKLVHPPVLLVGTATLSRSWCLQLAPKQLLMLPYTLLPVATCCQCMCSIVSPLPAMCPALASVCCLLFRTVWPGGVPA